jgi:hypothetical protein
MDSITLYGQVTLQVEPVTPLWQPLLTSEHGGMTLEYSTFTELDTESTWYQSMCSLHNNIFQTKEHGYEVVRTHTKNKWRSMLILNLRHGFDVIGTYTDNRGEPKIILEKRLNLHSTT